MTKLVEIAQSQDITINSVEAQIDECWGANTIEQFENINKVIDTKAIQ